MATRPIFLPADSADAFVKERMIEFTWHPGMSITQKRRSIQSLHEASQIEPILEVSSKAEVELGQNLSAFNLQFECGGGRHSVENWFQAAKSEADGEGFPHLLARHPREGGKFFRSLDSFRLSHFFHQGNRYPLSPRMAFYDWLYLSALMQSPALTRTLNKYSAFSDIEFNPKRSLNCQARSVARYCGLLKAGRLESAMQSWDIFVASCYGDSSELGSGLLPGFDE